MFIRFNPVMLLATTTLLGCTTDAPMIGTKFGNPPPRIIHDPANPSKVIWDRIEAFAPVPSQYIADGRSMCGQLDTEKVHYIAVGYHPRALDINGKVLPDGGFYCLPE